MELARAASISRERISRDRDARPPQKPNFSTSTVDAPARAAVIAAYYDHISVIDYNRLFRWLFYILLHASSLLHLL